MLIPDGKDLEPIPRLDNKFLNYIKPVNESAQRASSSSVHTPESILAADCFQHTLKNQLIFPWEEQSAFNPFFNVSDNIGLTDLLSHEGLTGADPVVKKLPAQITLANASKNNFAGVVARAKNLPWPEQQTAKRAKSFVRWKYLVEETGRVETWTRHSSHPFEPQISMLLV